jgi:hypothetical protein
MVEVKGARQYYALRPASQRPIWPVPDWIREEGLDELRGSLTGSWPGYDAGQGYRSGGTGARRELSAAAEERKALRVAGLHRGC